MPNFGSAIETNKIPVKGLVPQASATAPETPVAGELWTDTSTSPPVVKFYNGTSWVRVTGADLPDGTVTNAKVASNAGIALSKLAVDPLARANHTGTQPASTISGLAAAVQANRLDQMAQPTAPLDLNAQRVINAADGIDPSDLITKQQMENWVDQRVAGQDWKASARVATSANITLSGLQTIDGVELVAGDRVLVLAQTNATQNGLYTVASGGWVRTTDANDGTKVTAGMTVPVESGTSLGGTIWLLVTGNPITLGTTELSFVQIGAPGATYTAGAGLTLVGNEFRLDSPVPISRGGTGGATAADARTNLGAAGIFEDDLPELSPGVSVNVAHGLNRSLVQPVVVINATGEVITLDYQTIDANTLAVRADVAFAAGDLRIKVIG